MLPQAAGSSIHYSYFGSVDGGGGAVGWFRDWGETNLRYPDDSCRRCDSSSKMPLPRQSPISAPSGAACPVVDMMKKAGGPPTDFEAFVSHPPGDPWWDQFGFIKPEDRFDVPSLQVNSWYDFGVAETLQQFNQFRTNAVSAQRARQPVHHHLADRALPIRGATENTRVGATDLGDARFRYWDLYLRWFDHWLKGVDNGVTTMPKSGCSSWAGTVARRAGVAAGPHAATSTTTCTAGAANSRFGDGTLSPGAPTDEPPDSFSYDPAAPSPRSAVRAVARHTRRLLGRLRPVEVEAAQRRARLQHAAARAGHRGHRPPRAVLFVSSSARDTDFTAKLVDVYPDGTRVQHSGGDSARALPGWLHA